MCETKWTNREKDERYSQPLVDPRRRHFRLLCVMCFGTTCIDLQVKRKSVFGSSLFHVLFYSIRAETKYTRQHWVSSFRFCANKFLPFFVCVWLPLGCRHILCFPSGHKFIFMNALHCQFKSNGWIRTYRECLLELSLHLHCVVYRCDELYQCQIAIVDTKTHTHCRSMTCVRYPCDGKCDVIRCTLETLMDPIATLTFANYFINSLSQEQTLKRYSSNFNSNSEVFIALALLCHLRFNIITFDSLRIVVWHGRVKVVRWHRHFHILMLLLCRSIPIPIDVSTNVVEYENVRKRLLLRA